MFLAPKIRQLEIHRYKASGFTLVELMVTLAVVGILLSIAIPAYKDYLIRANKSAVKAVMLEIASRQEQYLMNSGAYATTYAQLNYSIPTEVSTYFDLTLTAGTNSTSTVTALQGLPTFTITASGKAGTIQAGQPAAGAATAYSINQFGLKLPVAAW